MSESSCIDASGAIVPGRVGETHFDVLGVAQTFALDARDLEVRYKTLSRQLHPDRFATAPQPARMLSLKRATDLNQAYRTLRDPVKRAEYLLSLSGVDVGREDGKGPKVDPEFLVEILELREGLAEAKAAADSARMSAMTTEVQARVDAAMVDIAAGFAVGELDRVTQAVVALRYYRRFLDEVEGDGEPATSGAP
jgi:molecular chaperone HscB